jgi:phosphatidylglycerol:prolipoprotein diacylglycerol transferase
VLLHFLSKKRKYDGQVALLYVAWYGLGRTFIEGLRMDSLYWGPFRVSQLLAALSCFAAVAALMFFHYFKQPDSSKMQVRLFEAQQAAKEEKKHE